MGALRKNPAGKVAAAIAFLVLVFTSAVFCFNLLSALPYAETDHWQDTSRFQNYLYQRQKELASGAAWTAALRKDTLSYVEEQQIQDDLKLLYTEMDAEATWFRFCILSSDGSQVLASNLREDENLALLVERIYYASFELGEYFVSQEYVDFDVAHTASPTSNSIDHLTGEESVRLIIKCGVPAEVDETVEDEFSRLATDWKKGHNSISYCTNNALFWGALACACLLYLLWTAGNRKGEDGIVLSWQDRVFSEAYLLVMAVLGCFAVWGIVEFGDFLYQYTYFQTEISEDLYRTAITGAAACTTALAVVIALTLRTLVVRLKAHALIRTTLICRLLGWGADAVREIFHSLPFHWRGLAVFALYVVLDVFFAQQAQYDGWAAMAWFLIHLVALLLLCRWSIGFQRLRKGGQAISGGNLTYQIDTRGMAHDLKAHAEDLNNLSQGMAEAVEERMRSERFKAELITNVSHDLKTPLTSIINYVNLLKTTEQTDPKAVQYIEVLDRKSQRLKKLTEDLVEASKASTGVLGVNREKIGMSQLLDQALGEWTEKLENQKLTVVTTLPEGETWVYADGCHLWRVIDNLLSNCAKYALEGTRIYLDLVRGKGQVILSVKNISRAPLNVPPEQLVERFVRGEESRTTEGSGLGLSIARSLTELQGGEFTLSVDGDLFKAIVTLPQAN